MYVSCYSQWVAAIGVWLAVLQVGFIMGWPSPNVTRFSATNSSIPMTSNDISWVVALGSLGGVPGAIMEILLVELLGSKKTVLCSFIIMSISWILLVIGVSKECVYVSRAFAGCAYGIIFGSFSLYVGEISPSKIRGTLVSIAVTALPLGMLISMTGETYLLPRVSSAVYLALSLLGILLFMWLEDSPYYVMKSNNVKNTEKSIAFYNNSSRFDEVRAFVEADNSTLRQKLQMFKSQPVWRSIFIVLMVYTLTIFNGSLVMTSYAEEILVNGKIDVIDPKKIPIYNMCVTSIAVIFAIKLVDKLGRKFLFSIAGIGTSIAWIMLGTYFFLLDAKYDNRSLQWMTIVSIQFYEIMYVIGFLIVPSTILSKIFSDNIKSTGSCLANVAASVVGFIVLKSYQQLSYLIGYAYLFWIYAVLCMLCVPFSLFLLPETKGKSFQEIQEKLGNTN